MNIKVWRGNITTLNVECIVNAANPGLGRGEGVCGAIFSATGLDLDKYIFKNYPHGCHTGDCVATPAYGECLGVGIQSIIHAVGPSCLIIGNTDLSDMLLRMTYARAMQLAITNNVKSIAFPMISTGVYAFPRDRATTIALDTISEFSTQANCPEVTLVGYSEVDATFLAEAVLQHEFSK